jgi:gp16 family phage-associated protein
MKTRKEVMDEFEAKGETVIDWAKRHDFKPRTVYAVLHGQLKAKRGISHTIAVKLGLKDAPSNA